jgi:hypothetical protein
MKSCGAPVRPPHAEIVLNIEPVGSFDKEDLPLGQTRSIALDMQASNPAGTWMDRWKNTEIAKPLVKPSANSLTRYVAGVAQVTSVVLGVGVDMEHCTTPDVG